jgi:hypothetical protein
MNAVLVILMMATTAIALQENQHKSTIKVQLNINSSFDVPQSEIENPRLEVITSQKSQKHHRENSDSLEKFTQQDSAEIQTEKQLPFYGFPQTINNKVEKIQSKRAIQMIKHSNNTLEIQRSPNQYIHGLKWSTDVIQSVVEHSENQLRESSIKLEKLSQHVSKIQTEMHSAKNYIDQTMNVEFEKLQSALDSQATKTDQANKDIEMLQTDYRQQVEIQEKQHRKTIEFQKTINSSLFERFQNASETTLSAVKTLQKQHEEEINSVKNLTHQISKIQVKMQSSIEQNNDSNNKILIHQMLCIKNQSIEAMDIKFLELTTKTDKASKNIEALESVVQQLVEDSRKMRAEIKLMSDKMSLEKIHAEHATLNSEHFGLVKQLISIRKS